MPVREEKLVERAGLGKTKFLMTQKQWDELDERVLNIDKWNKEVSIFVEELTKQVEATISCRAFRSIHEHTEGERFSPRNYLSFEVIVVEVSGKVENYYLAQHRDLEELKETIIKDLYVRRAGKKEQDGGSCENSIGGDGREPRTSRLERYTEKVCESIDVVQSAKRRARGNTI